MIHHEFAAHWHAITADVMLQAEYSERQSDALLGMKPLACRYAIIQLRAVNGLLVETHADGTETVIRAIHNPVKVKVGVKFKLKRRDTTAVFAVE